VTQVQTPFTTTQRMSWLIHGYSKKGKSTLAATAPKPVLVLDAEGSWRFIPARKVEWNPLTETPPTYPVDERAKTPQNPEGRWDVCIVYIAEWATVQMTYNYLTQWPNLFTTCGPVSVVIDSITEIQRRCRTNLKGTDAMKIQDWGVLLSLMDATIRGFRDLCLMPQLAVRCVVFVSETREGTNGRLVPYMQGQIAVSLPYWVDVCGYLYPDYEVDGNGQATQEVRRLWIGPHQQYESGERVQGKLGSVLTILKPPPDTVGIDIEWWMRIIFNMLPSPDGAQAQTLERSAPL
jgi:hypothetical protein